ncbi:hypothetical protein [Parasitella parasitica]|uniref:Tyr recombinase domain-containing protein n=1 Tax=Parasitella parasitica TaxID=35722 RepID=A0A0B7MMW9_9FUNG|nr:hypothetical protein [Parasitella parasitica]
MTAEHLTQKVCFLLAITGFLRNADIYRINLSKVELLQHNTQLRLVIHCPKEKRRGSPIERVVIICAHVDPFLCPVSTYITYRQRIASSPGIRSNPTRPSRTINYLIRRLQDHSQQVGTQTIGRHFHSLLALIEVDRPTSGSHPLRARAVGSTNSVLHGANADDILAPASWFSSSIFDTFYRLSRETVSDFTSLALSSNSQATLTVLSLPPLFSLYKYSTEIAISR